MKPTTLGDSMPVIKRTVPPPQPPAETYKLTADDILDTLPIEYREAKASPMFIAETTAVVKAGSTLLVMGTPGIGKTYQLFGILRNTRMNAAKSAIQTGETFAPTYDGKRWRFDPHEAQWRSAMIAKIKANDAMRIISESSDIRRHRYDHDQLDAWCRFHGLLAVDDIGFVAPTEWVREAIYEIATHRRRHKLATIWTTNLNAASLDATFGGAITSRLGGGAVLALDGKDRRL
jgi:hypothetical protein